jgi:hypothetical protein
MKSQAKWQAVFVIGMLLAGVIEAPVAICWGGFGGFEGVWYSDVLCLLPGCITILIVSATQRTGLAAYTVLVGIGLRVIFVVAGLLVFKSVRPDLGFREFVVWLLVNYLVALALETWVVVRLSRESSVAV